MTNHRSARQLLQLLRSAGVTHLPAVKLPKPEKPGRQLRRTTGVVQKVAQATSVQKTHRSLDSRSSLTSPQNLRPDAAVLPDKLEEVAVLLKEKFETADQKAQGLCRLAEYVAKCRRCTALAESRRQTVFGTGNPNADIMFVGEAPGADEDRQGEPFVGAAGQLLNKIIQACGLKREDIYICNILRCRPPGNRNPLPQEAANCREFLDGQIQIVQPSYIVCWGTVAAQNLLGETDSVGRLRGRFLQYGPAKVLCTYHPSYLLRNPTAKKQVWEDMKFFMKEVGLDSN